ncbi:glycosyl-4,4'-diaponeurosporenoate acyltransferase CrtO family protein [Psychroserpens sp.]
MIKKILLSIATIFLIWQSYNLLYNIDKLAVNSYGLLFFIAWIINLFITGIFAFSGFAFPTQKLLPRSYYKVYHPKRLKKIYNALRVNLFRQMLLATLWKSKKQRKKYFNGKENGISNLVEQSMKSEFGHLIPFIIICFVSSYLIVIGAIKLGVFSLLINLIGNLYPIILQRHHRMRIQIIRKRQQSTSRVKHS